MKKETVDEKTGLVEHGQLNQMVVVKTPRKNGTKRVQYDYKWCPTMAEQHTAHLTDINYLIKKFQPDELGAYIAAQNAHKREILGHDFSIEPNLQQARNITYSLRKSFDELPDEIKNNFKNHVEFLKFINNPANAEKMLKLGLMTKKEIQKHTDPLNNNQNQNQNQKQDPSSTNQKKSPHEDVK